MVEYAEPRYVRDNRLLITLRPYIVVLYRHLHVGLSLDPGIVIFQLIVLCRHGGAYAVEYYRRVYMV